MRFNKLYITLFFTITGAIAGYAQEEQASVSAMRGELNFLYSHILGGKSIGLGGFGSDFHSVLTPVARFAERDEIWARQPLFNLGLEGNLILKPFYQNSAITLAPSLGYSLRYSHERYHIAYDPDNQNNLLSAGSIGGRGSKEDIQMNSLINQLAFGVRLDHNQSKLYANFSLGMLLYTPLSLKWHRQAYDANGNPSTSVTHSVRVGQVVHVTDDNDFAGWHNLSLRGTAEFLASIGARVGYGPLFMGINYATNMRVNVVSFDLGITLHPFARSNS